MLPKNHASFFPSLSPSYSRPSTIREKLTTTSAWYSFLQPVLINKKTVLCVKYLINKRFLKLPTELTTNEQTTSPRTIKHSRSQSSRHQFPQTSNNNNKKTTTATEITTATVTVTATTAAAKTIIKEKNICGFQKMRIEELLNCIEETK